MEAGSYEAGVETVTADSLAVAGRETLYEHPGAGAATELVEIIRRDKLEPLSPGDALDAAARHAGPDGKPVLMINDRSKHAAAVLPSPSRILDDGGMQERVRLLRPAVREAMARAELDASAWRRAGETAWRAAWDAETAGPALKRLGCTVEIVSWRARRRGSRTRPRMPAACRMNPGESPRSSIAAMCITGAPVSVPPPLPYIYNGVSMTSHTLPEDPDYCFCPAYDVEDEVQQSASSAWAPNGRATVPVWRRDR